MCVSVKLRQRPRVRKVARPSGVVLSMSPGRRLKRLERSNFTRAA